MSLPGRVGLSRALREKRLLALLQGRTPEELALDRAVESEQVAGSLELAGIATAAEAQVPDRPERQALLRARRAVDPASPFTVAALLAWHREVKGPVGLRTVAVAHEAEPSAPPAFVASRLEILQ